MTPSERILQFVDFKEISKREFYRQTSITNGLFSKTSGVGSDSLEKIAQTFPELNLIWVITGEGSMLNNGINTTPVVKEENPFSQLLEEMRTIKEKMQEEMEFLREQLTRATNELSSERQERRQLQELLGKH